MTGQIKNKPQFSILCFVWLFAISIFCVSIGLKLLSGGGCTVTFDKGGYASLREMIIGLSGECAADVASFLLITIASKPCASLALSSVMLALRGISLGMCASFCAENAVSASSVAMIISFAMVSLLMLVYTVFVSKSGSGFMWRVISYLLVTGAAVLLRVLPIVLL